MKNICMLTAIMACLIGQGQGQAKPNSGFILNGKYAGQSAPWLFLFYANDKNEQVKDSCLVKDGVFSFKGIVTEPAMGYLMAKAAKGSNNSIQFFLEPAVMTITITEDNIKDAIVTGSIAQKEWDMFIRHKEPIRKEMEPLTTRYTAANQEYMNARKNNADEKTLDTLKYRAAAIHDLFEPYNVRMKKEDFKFFETHPSSAVTAFYLRFYVSSLTLDSLKMFYDRMGIKMQQMSFGKNIQKEIEKLQDGSPGSMARNFSTVNINGKPLQLTDYKGKYVLLDFWASWCVPCRKGNPHLKELYAQYRGKGFEVIGVSDDDRDHEAWKKAVEKDGLPWQHVLRGLRFDATKGAYDRSADISELFGIHTLPTQILLDPAGKIIGRYDENGSANGTLDKMLADILK